jgi:phytanoyl-CoA hydroxylase
MKLSDKQLSDYKKNGYILIKGFFEKKLIEKIFAEIREVYAIQLSHFFNITIEKSLAMSEEEFSQQMYRLNDKDPEAYVNCGKQAQHIMSLHALGASEKVTELLQALGLKRPVISVRPCILTQNPRIDKSGDKGKYWRLPTHQDWYYSMGSLDSLNIWLSWVPCDKALGAMEMIPGSHLWGLQDAKDEGFFGEMTEKFADERFISLDTEPGDVLLFYSILVHRSGTNSTNRLRWSTQFRYNNLYEPTFIDRKFPNPFIYQSTKLLDREGFPNAEDMERWVWGKEVEVSNS